MFVEDIDTTHHDLEVARHTETVLFTMIISKVSICALKGAACIPDSEVGQHHLQATPPGAKMS